MDRGLYYILMIRKDGQVLYATNISYDSRKRLVIDFYPSTHILCHPYMYDDAALPMMHFRKWQRDFPADADGWIPDVQEFEL